MRLLQLTTVLVADDLTTTSDAALRTAAALRDGGGARLHVVHVAPAGTAMAAHGGVRAEFQHAMQDGAVRAKVATDYTPHVLTGSAGEAIGPLADRISADVIVTGRREHGAVQSNRRLGGTAFDIIRRSLVPCLAVGEPMTIPLRRVLVAIDYSEASRGALVVGLSWASALRDRKGTPTLTALHVSDRTADPDAKTRQDVDHELDVLRRAAGDWAGVDVNGMTVQDTDTARAIAKQAESMKADLVVLGTRGANPQDGALGSVSAAVLEVVATPVLLVPPAVWRDYAKEVDYF